MWKCAQTRKTTVDVLQKDRGDYVLMYYCNSQTIKLQKINKSSKARKGYSQNLAQGLTQLN